MKRTKEKEMLFISMIKSLKEGEKQLYYTPGYCFSFSLEKVEPKINGTVYDTMIVDEIYGTKVDS